MAENIKMEDGVAIQFKGQMQGAFDFLEDCSNSIENCQILEELGFDNGSMAKFKSSIKTTEDSINGLLESITSCENQLLQLDSNGTERVSEIFPIDEESRGDIQGNDSSSLKSDLSTTSGDSSGSTSSTSDSSSSSSSGGSKGPSSDSSSSSSSSDSKGSSSDSSSSSSSGDSKVSSSDSSSSSSSGDSTSSSSDSSSSTESNTSSSGSSSTSETPSQNNNNTSYSFTYTKEEALKNGDIFADDKYNLTEFTNYLLYKYGIKDKNIAQRIYESVINYGNTFYKTNGTNPLKVVPEKEIISSIYNSVKDLVPNSSEDTFWTMINNIKL